MTLDELYGEYKNGDEVEIKGDAGRAVVKGVCYTIPAEAGGPEQPALVVLTPRGGIGHLLPTEVYSHTGWRDGERFIKFPND